ncbi:hypothetical protein COCVIDRAFT_22963 [Bipolaris victoriae FI3]|uniref:Uncharacterized protein n=2 Tax=Bipolaris TaxID=33194 RepID=W6YIW5_COCC2|nr:uncharacterized protein COCCADRAFT_1572 [Bipolaris zeicola 26-R-13]XP_014560925.1 hypothetical protein COCVIDRAFT_22963 [Bipolaris victoriae FI3]EUC37515.1 hypothetical protein COCCADRAFT_1572 [Bipolaris zeicola 26-R-13]
MKSFIAILAFASCALAAPIAQGSYDGYGDYANVPTEAPAEYADYGDYGNAPPVENPNPPADYADYGAYPPPAGGYGEYTGYKKE